MSSATDKHGQDHLELVCLYALEALPSSEVTALEAHISACAHCQRELETLRPIVESFVSWPTDVLRPSTSLRDASRRESRLIRASNRCWSSRSAGRNRNGKK
jgi:hypothetical protein